MTNPSHEHIAFLSTLWLENIPLTMGLLINAFPKPADLPDISETLRYVRQCRDRGYEPAPCDVLNGIPDGSAPQFLPSRVEERGRNVILGNEPGVLRNRYPASQDIGDIEYSPFAMWQ